MLETRSEPRSVSSPRVSSWRAGGNAYPCLRSSASLASRSRWRPTYPKWSTSREHRSAGVSSRAWGDGLAGGLLVGVLAVRRRGSVFILLQVSSLTSTAGILVHGDTEDGTRKPCRPGSRRSPAMTGLELREQVAEARLWRCRFGKLSVGPRSYGGSCRRS
jgi:hypothetical protein